MQLLLLALNTYKMRGCTKEHLCDKLKEEKEILHDYRYQMNWNRSVSMVTKLWTGWSRNRGSVLGMGKRLAFGPTNTIIYSLRQLKPGPFHKGQLAGHEADFLSAPIARVNNPRCYTYCRSPKRLKKARGPFYLLHSSGQD